MKTYRIKPLEWITLNHISLIAYTPFGDYTIEKHRKGVYSWGYCFDEYHDEGRFKCDLFEDGKAKAQAHWEEKLKQVLEEV